ncbi:WD40 repeat domain-containing protein [Candidatus Poribacteria bacterium]|nr:WD40 repeat domain-containing protein [Candidatus Poribacteria bacterium]MYI93155.1 WD40 repeat domain-containing protein [Candidatus Poribacteria bacterium]
MEKKKSEISIQENINNEDAPTWALPDGAIARLGRGCEPNMAFSPDGRFIGIGTLIGIWLYDQETLSPIALWETEEGVVVSIAFSYDGKWIAASNTNNILKVLNLENGDCLAKVKTDDFITELAISQDNCYIAGAYARSSAVEVWETETCKPIATLYADTDSDGFYRPILFSPDSKLIVSTYRTEETHDEDAIAVWNVENGQQVASLTNHTSWVSSLSFSPCGQFLASGGEDGTVYVWDVNTWKPIKEYTSFGHVYRIIPSYTPDGILRTVIITYDDTNPTTITVCNLESGEELYRDHIWGSTVEFSSAYDWGNRVTFSNGSELAYECRHEFINVWTSNHPYKRQFTHSPISFPTSGVFSDDGKTLAIEHHQECAILWDIATKRSRPAIREESAGKNQFLYKCSNDKLYAASIKDDTVTLWDTDGDCKPLFKGTDREYWGAIPAMDLTGSFFAYTGEEGKIIVWDVQNKTQLFEFTHPIEIEDNDDEDDGDRVGELKFNHDGSLLASETRYGNIILWDMKTGEKIKTLTRDSLSSGKYFPDKEEDNTKSECDWTRFETHLNVPITEDIGQVIAWEFSTCEKYLAAAACWKEASNQLAIYLWEVETGRTLTTFWGHPIFIQALTFSSDNKLLASIGKDGSILLWDLSPFIDN